MHMLAHTRMGRPIRVWDTPYVYRSYYYPICMWENWASDMSAYMIVYSFIANN